MFKSIRFAVGFAAALCATAALAQTSQAPPAAPPAVASPTEEGACPMMVDQKPGMPPMGGMPGMPGMGAMRGNQSGPCAEMMQARAAARAELAAFDAKLDGLMAKLDAAKGNQRLDAMAAVLHELVAQRKVMRERMESMQQAGMQHAMQHLQMGMMKGLMGAGHGCPMMGDGQAKEEQKPQR